MDRQDGMSRQTAAEALVAGLESLGVLRVYCVPGESYLPVLDALSRSQRIATVTCRHEGGAGFMAVAEAKMRASAGVAMVSRGPGAANATVALHLAEQDAVPLVLFVGDVARAQRHKGAFQEVDYAQMFGRIAKHVETLIDPARMSEVIRRAFDVAEGGTPGPVVVVLPEDVLAQKIDAQDPPIRTYCPPTSPSREAIAWLLARLAASRNPLIVAGSRLGSEAGRASLLRAAETLNIPVALSFKHQDLMPNGHRLYGGHLGFGAANDYVRLVESADLILAVGTRFGDVSSQSFRLPAARQVFVHVYPDPAVTVRARSPQMALHCDPTAFLDTLSASAKQAPAERAAWIDRVSGFVQAQRQWVARPPAEDGVDFGAVTKYLDAHLPSDAIFVLDSGNFSTWLHRYGEFDGARRVIGAVGGAMGLGVPGGIAVALCEPDRTVVTLVGDGGALMTGAELATAVAQNISLLVVVSNNGSYGTIRQHMNRRYPGLAHATELTNPDFADFAQSFGAAGFTIGTEAEISPVLDEALRLRGPRVVDVRSSLTRLSAAADLNT